MFKILNANYAIDKNTASCGDSKLPNVDIATFEVLEVMGMVDLKFQQATLLA
ncbi:MAG: DKNYY domain-containing protein [Xanthomonadales bacterium]|nr:DKNYY domain-containing protein [Xanthomonadales bacterium]